MFVLLRHHKGQPYVPRELQLIQIRIERAPTTTGNGMLTTRRESRLISMIKFWQVEKECSLYLIAKVGVRAIGEFDARVRTSQLPATRNP